MLTIKVQGEEHIFEGINGEMDERGYTNATEFYNKTESLIIQFKDCGKEPSDMYHSLFMNTLLEHITEHVENEDGELLIDLDNIISTIGGNNEVYTIETTRTPYIYMKHFVTHFKLITIVDFLLIPIQSVEINGAYTELKYGNKVMMRICPTNRRFPPFVSEQILTGEINKVSERNILGYKLLDMDKVLKYGITLDYINYKG